MIENSSSNYKFIKFELYLAGQLYPTIEDALEIGYDGTVNSDHSTVRR